LAYLRRFGSEDIVVLLNFTPVPRFDYRVGVPRKGSYAEILNSDSRFYGGSDIGNPGPAVATADSWMDRPCSFLVNLPPLAGVVFKRIG
jgi:1,4-alpha-glucan branching enzyme